MYLACAVTKWVCYWASKSKCCLCSKSKCCCIFVGYEHYSPRLVGSGQLVTCVRLSMVFICFATICIVSIQMKFILLFCSQVIVICWCSVSKGKQDFMWSWALTAGLCWSKLRCGFILCLVPNTNTKQILLLHPGIYILTYNHMQGHVHLL